MKINRKRPPNRSSGVLKIGQKPLLYGILFACFFDSNSNSNMSSHQLRAVDVTMGLFICLLPQ